MTDLAKDLYNHYHQILERVEHFIKLPHISSDQLFRNNMKVIEERLRRFIESDAIMINKETPQPAAIIPEEIQNENVATACEEQPLSSDDVAVASTACLDVKFMYSSPLDYKTNKNKYATTQDERILFFETHFLETRVLHKLLSSFCIFFPL